MADTLSGHKFYVCATAQNADINATAFAALTWVEVKGIGSMGETGLNQNFVTYNTLADAVAQKGKGVANAGDPELVGRRIWDDAGQVIMRTIGASSDKNSYAYKYELADGSSTLTNTIRYNRGLCGGPRHPGGGVEDFDLEAYTLALVQEQEVVNPTAI